MSHASFQFLSSYFVLGGKKKILSNIVLVILPLLSGPALLLILIYIFDDGKIRRDAGEVGVEGLPSPEVHNTTD